MINLWKLWAMVWKCNSFIKKWKFDTLWEIDTKNFVSYKTFAEFKSNFSIDGVAIKDNWDKIKSLQYDC